MAWYLTDERTMFPIVSLDRIAPTHRIAVLTGYLGAVRPAPVYAAYAIGVAGWETTWRIVDIHGLTDPDLAQEPPEARGRPGHEHVASADSSSISNSSTASTSRPIQTPCGVHASSLRSQLRSEPLGSWWQPLLHDPVRDPALFDIPQNVGDVIARRSRDVRVGYRVVVPRCICGDRQDDPIQPHR
jgi:hypothetical protein